MISGSFIFIDHQTYSRTRLQITREDTISELESSSGKVCFKDELNGGVPKNASERSDYFTNIILDLLQKDQFLREHSKFSCIETLTRENCSTTFQDQNQQKHNTWCSHRKNLQWI